MPNTPMVLRPEPPTSDFRDLMGRRIKCARERAGLTQEQAAEMARISPREYQRWEAGDTDIVPSDLDRLRRSFGCCITALWPGYPGRP